MALVSPGVEVTVIDESQYIPSAVNTVPYFVIATAQNKVSANGTTVAAGTLAANANKTYLITSQRDLAATYGVPFFYQTTAGTPINGYELNEYGLLAAYSALGITNRAYIQRVDIDLAELTASLTRPTGNAPDGSFWLDTSTSVWGIQEWNQTTNAFTVKTPLQLVDPTDVVNYASNNYYPLQSIGSIGDYAISAMPFTSTQPQKMPGFYKRGGPVLNNSTNYTPSDLSDIYNTWVEVGSNDWKTAWPTVTGTGTPGSLTIGSNIYINGTLCEVGSGTGPSTAATTIGFANAINELGIQGVYAAVVNGKLYLYADSTTVPNDSSLSQGAITIEGGTSGSSTLLAALGLTTGIYFSPLYQSGYSYQSPRWRTTDTQPHPTGSVWNNMSPVNNGLSVKVKKYSAALDTFVSQETPAYIGDYAALYALDPSGGGKNIPVGTTFIQWYADGSTTQQQTMSFELLERTAIGATVVTGGTATPTFVSSSTFVLNASQPGTSTGTGATVTVNGTDSTAFVSAVSAANVPNVSASVDSSGFIVFTHATGGTIALTDGTNAPIAAAGFTNATPGVRPSNQIGSTALLLTNWSGAPEFTFTPSDTAPDQDPADGRLWYYSTVSDADIMIQNGNRWVGYKTVSNDVRGFNLTLTNAAGPIIAAAAPTTQTDTAASPLQPGDLWIDTSDLENYPKLYRWEPVNGVQQWVEVDTTDQVTENGILFADARWSSTGTADPVADPFPTITSLLSSNYKDLDAPNPALYPQGMLMFNTRRSGYNVKSFQVDYFNVNSTDFTISAYSSSTQYTYNSFVTYNGIVYVVSNTSVNPPVGTAPTNSTYWAAINTNTWLSASGNKDNGAMWSGRQAQRQLVVQALKAGIDTSIAAREEQSLFSLLATPAYPELIPNMVALSNERNNTVFVIGDTPMRLAGNGTDLTTWATNNNGLGLVTEDGLTAASQYMATFYPSCQTTDLGGNVVVQPPSHMMVRTIIRSDEVSYPWLAPAGTRRGVIDNATAIGYIDATTGEFQQINVGQGLRDVLYDNDINPITFIPGVGITNFGNKTTTSITSALDRINVSRLVAFLRGRLEEIGKLYLFEPNDEITRNEITNTVNSLMIDLIAKRAIYDYLVVCDLSNNTPARIDRNELWVDIAIEPVKAVEFIYIPLRIKNTGEISGAAA